MVLTLVGVDHRLGERMSALDEEGEGYTVMVFSDPAELPPYRSEFDGVATGHVDLKRGLDDEFEGVVVNRRGNETERDTRGLFEKYQFFTPGKSLQVESEKGGGGLLT